MSFETPSFTPMQAISGPLPTNEGWAYELKWDGMRVLAANQGGQTKLRARSGIDITTTFPELGSLAPSIGAVGDGITIVDGEVVAFLDGIPSFEQLQHRMHVSQPPQHLINKVPVVYMVFDLLMLDGQSMFDIDYKSRRSLLREVVPDSVCWKVPAYSEEHHAPLVTLSKSLKLEGVIAKRLDSKYLAGKRSPSWVKVKNLRRQEFVIGGWLEGQGNLRGKIGSLLVGTWEDNRLVFAGAVGSGISSRTRGLLQKGFNPTTECPFDPAPDTTRPPQWIETCLTAEVAYLSWTPQGKLRQPTLQGLRSDKNPRLIIRESTGHP